jgi:hypothetical protein
MKTREAIKVASKHLEGVAGHVFDILELTKPVSPDAALNLFKVISKLSPLLGNMLEFNTVEFLNTLDEFKPLGTWKRQDPDFPDALFVGKIDPAPGFEIKAWFPLATEITARFRDSQSHFLSDQTYVAMLAWLPEHLIYGKPYVINVCVVSAASVAASRDSHYHNPPDYLVLEPQDTSARTRNLQQTNTNGLKFQGPPKERAEAEKIVASWGPKGKTYSPSKEYQARLQGLVGKFAYRLDTNFAKMDRIVHPEIEVFKEKVLNTKVNGMTVKEWQRVLASDNDGLIRTALAKHLNITAVEADHLLG